MPRVRTNLQRALGRRSVERLRNLDVTPLEHVNVSITDLTLNLTTNSNLNNSSFVENPDWYKNIGIDNSSEMVHVHVRNFGGNNTGEPILPSDPGNSIVDHSVNYKEIAEHLESSVMVDATTRRNFKRVQQKTQSFISSDVEEEASLEFVKPLHMSKHLLRHKSRKPLLTNKGAFDDAFNDTDPESSIGKRTSGRDDNLQISISGDKSLTEVSVNGKKEKTSPGTLDLSNLGKGLRRRRLRGTANPNQEAFDEALDGSDPAPSMSDSNSKRNANIAEDSVELETSIKKSRKRSAADSKNIDEIDTSRDALELSSSGKGLRRRRLRGTANPNQEAFDEALDGSDPAPSMSDSNSKRNANTAEDSVELETSPTKSGGRSAANSKNLNEIDNLDNPAVNSDVPGQSGLVISLNGKDKYKAKVKKVSQSLEKSYTELESSLSSSPSRVRDQAYISVSARSSLMPSGSVHLEKSVSVSLRDELAEDGMNITGELSGSNHPYSEPAGGTLLPRKNLHSLASSGNYSDDFPDSDQVSSVKFNMQSNLNDRDVLATSIVALENYVSDVEPLTNVSAETNIQANRSVPSLKTSANHISSSVRKPIQSDKAESLNAVGLCEETTKLIQVDLKRWLIQQKEALKVKTVSSMTMTTDPVVFKKPKQPVGKEVKKVDSYFGDYRPPKKVKPRPYVTNNMYNFIERKLAAQYGIESRLKAEAFVTFMCGIVDTVIKRKSKYHGKVDELRDEMLKLDLISTQIEFHVFIEKYLPPDFRFKAIPCFGCDLGPPSIPSKDLYKPLRK